MQEKNLAVTVCLTRLKGEYSQVYVCTIKLIMSMHNKSIKTLINDPDYAFYCHVCRKF